MLINLLIVLNFGTSATTSERNHSAKSSGREREMLSEIRENEVFL
jgi:hypothetical protein